LADTQKAQVAAKKKAAASSEEMQCDAEMECDAPAAAAAAALPACREVVLRGIKLWQVAAQLGVPAASLFARTEQSGSIPDMSNENMVPFFVFQNTEGSLWNKNNLFCGILLLVRM
jgi:hypothetical protein